MMYMKDPGFIPPVRTFFDDEDARSTGSSVTTSDVLTKYGNWSNHAKAYIPSLSPTCSVITERLEESEVAMSAQHIISSAVNVSVRSVSAVSKDELSVVTEKVSDHVVSTGSGVESEIRLKMPARESVGSPPESKTSRLLKTREFARVGTAGSNTATRSGTPSPRSTLLSKVPENRFCVRPDITVASNETDKVSVNPKAKSKKSSDEKASVGGTTMSANAEKRSVAGTAVSVMADKDSDDGIPGKGGKITKASGKASALPPVHKKMPQTVKEFTAKGISNASRSNSPYTLSIPALSKTSVKQLHVRAETPTTPKISNARSSINRNLRFSKPGIHASRSMSPSFERSTVVNNMLPSKTIETSSQTKKEGVSSSGKNETSSKNPSSLDTIESAIIVSDILSSTRAIARGDGKDVNKETPPLHKKKTNAGASIIQSQSFSHSEMKDKKQIVMSSSFETTRKTNGKDVSDKSHNQNTKKTRFKKALSFGSNSTKDKSNPSYNDEGIRVYPGSANSTVCSTGSTKSSRNSASDTSTAASTLSKSSSENRSECNFSAASTECTRKASNRRVKSSIKQSLSFTHTQEAKQPIPAARSMSPSSSFRLDFLPSTRTDLKDDVREIIDLSAAKNTPLSSRAPSYQVSEQRREMITVVLEAKKAKRDHDRSRVVISVPKVASDKETNSTSTDSSETKEGVDASNGDETPYSTDSNLKRKQILFGNLLRSRQERRKKASSSMSLLASDISDERGDIKMPPLQSVDSDNPLKSNKVKKTQNKYSNMTRKSGMRSQDKSSGELVVTDRVSDVTGSAFVPQCAGENKDKNQMDANASIGESVPLTQIDIVPNHIGDDTSLTLDPELSHKHKFQIWHEDTGYVEASSEERYSCVGVGFKFQTDESSITLTNDGDDFVSDDLSNDWRKEHQDSPLAFCVDGLGEEFVGEMKSAASQIVACVKNATWSMARKLFGLSDTTANGGVDYLADEVNAMQQQLIEGTIPHNKSVRSYSLAEIDVPTAQLALDEAYRQELLQKKENHPNKGFPGSSKHSLTRELTIVEKQEQARIDREKQDFYKKKKHVQKLKSLALKHM